MASNGAGSDFLVVRMNHCNAGFFAQVQFAINQIAFAERKGLTPVVYFGRDSVDGDNPYYDEAVGPNVWEYYFLQVSGVGLDEARLSAAQHGRRLRTLKYWALWYLHWGEPRSVFTYPYGYYHFVKDKGKRFDEQWWEAERAAARRVVDRYVRVRPEILHKVDDFQRTHFASNTLGVHARGTDKRAPSSAAGMARIVTPPEYFPFIDGYLAENPDAAIFFATDQKQFRAEMVSRYGSRVISYAKQLSSSKVNVFQMRGETASGNFTKGEEVLIDALLLSRCQFLLKCTSAVGEFAHYFSPTLKSIDLNFVVEDADRQQRATAASLQDAAKAKAIGVAFFAARLWYDYFGMGLEDAARPTRPAKILNTNSYVEASQLQRDTSSGKPRP